MSGQPLIYRVARFVNEKILRNTKESSVDLIQNVTAGRVFLTHALKARLRFPLKLQPMNSTIPFPMPSRFSHQEWNYNHNAAYMTIKRLIINLQSAHTKEKNSIEMSDDRSRSMIYVMKLLYTFREREVQEIDKIIKTIGIDEETVRYYKARELMFADSIVNGENPFMLRRLRHERFGLDESREIHGKYLHELEKALKSESFTEDNLKEAGLTADELRSKIHKGEAYCMLFEDFEKLSGGKPLRNQPTIVMDNEEVGEQYVMQIPFPVFVRVGHHFLNVAVGFRYQSEGGDEIIKFFSPFFSSQPQKLWRLAQNHLASVIFNDFNVRVHLSGWHLSTNQFNVPIYNYLDSKGRTAELQNNLSTFLDYGYTTFNRGLQDINTISFATLIHPVYQYSLVNRIFNMSQETAINLMASFVNRIDFSKWSPRELLAANGISEEEARKHFDVFGLQFKLYDIISKHIRNIWDIYEMDRQASSLMVAINKEIDNMVVGSGRRRDYLTEKDVLPLITNLVYTWAGYHSHTFGSILLNTYWRFRPTMMKKEIPYEEKEWAKIVVGEEYPHTKVLMEGAKLEAATTQRDSDYTLLGVMKRQAVQVGEEIDFRNVLDIEKHRRLKQSLDQVVAELQEFEKEVAAVNKKREAEEKLLITWMSPSDMQSSLNT